MAMANVDFLLNPIAFSSLRYDLAAADAAYVLAFKVQEVFFNELFSGFAGNRPIKIVANHSEELVLRQLMRAHQQLEAYVWSKNRLFHSKIIALPSIGVVHIGSHNLTRYAYTSAFNTTVRVHNIMFVNNIVSMINNCAKLARGLNPWQPEE